MNLAPFRHALAALALLIATCSALVAQPAPGAAAPTPPSATNWLVVEDRPLDVQGTMVALSPDGQWTAGIDYDGQFCIWSVATLEATCDTVPLPVAVNSIAWAPDSTAVAYTLDTLIQFAESDLFVFELAAGASRNLTDDGVDEIGLGTPAAFPVAIDLFPAWAADSQSLTFARTDYAEDEQANHLMTIARDGGAPELRYTIAPHLAWPIASSMYSLADGSLVFAMNPINPDPPEQGFWHLDTNGEATQILSGTLADAFPMPVIVDVAETATGTRISGYSLLNRTQFSTDTPFTFVLDLESRAVTPLVHPEDATNPLQPAGLSPDGETITAMAWNGSEVELVMLGAQTSVTALTNYAAPATTMLFAPNWAGNGTILLPGVLYTPLLVTVQPVAPAG